MASPPLSRGSLAVRAELAEETAVAWHMTGD
jgi:hypothetical protein